MKEKIGIPLRTLILFPLVFIAVFASMHAYSRNTGLEINLFGALEIFTLSGVSILLYIFIRIVTTIFQLIFEIRKRNNSKIRGIHSTPEEERPYDV